MAAMFTISLAPRWPNAVASSGTRAIAPPRTRSWTAATGAVAVSRCSRIVSAASRGQPVDEDVRPRAERRRWALRPRVHLRVADRPDHVGERGREGADRRDRPLTGLGAARVDHQGDHDGLAVLLRGDERQRRRLQDVRDHRELLRGRVRRGDQPGDHVGARGEQQHPADDVVDLVEPEPQPGRDTEVAAAAPERPEEIGVRLLVHLEQLAVGGHHLGARAGRRS